MVSEADPIVGIPGETTSSVSRPAVRPRWEGGLIAAIAALAGFGAGWIGGTGTLAPLAALLILIAFASIVASFGLASRAADPLRASGMDEFRRELDRARRHRRPFALIRLGLHPERTGGEPVAPASGWPIDGNNGQIRVIGELLRITDRAWHDGDGVMILQPETDRASAEAFAGRLRSSVADGPATRISIAVFPDDGLTSGALIDSLNRAERGDPLPEPLTRTSSEPSPLADDRPVRGHADDLRTEAG